MSNYQKILSTFVSLGYNESSYLSQEEINKALDTLAQQNTSHSQFDKAIADELWNHCVVDANRGVRLDDFVNTIVEAESILRDQVEVTEGALKIENRDKEKAELEKQYKQIISDHELISGPFNLMPLKQSRVLETSTAGKNGISFLYGDSVLFGY